MNAFTSHKTDLAPNYTTHGTLWTSQRRLICCAKLVVWFIRNFCRPKNWCLLKKTNFLSLNHRPRYRLCVIVHRFALLCMVCCSYHMPTKYSTSYHRFVLHFRADPHFEEMNEQIIINHTHTSTQMQYSYDCISKPNYLRTCSQAQFHSLMNVNNKRIIWKGCFPLFFRIRH